MINTFVALLVEFDLLTDEEGDALAQKIREGTLWANYPTARRQVKTWLKEVKEGK